MLNKKDYKSYIDRYNIAYRKYGYSTKSLCWSGGCENQSARFCALLDVRKFIKNDIFNVLDVGCGFGDFAKYMYSNSFKGQYTGIDINENLLEEANKQNEHESTFLCCDVFSNQIGINFDVVFESGLFNYKLTNQDQLRYIAASLERMYSLCNYAISCNFISTYVDWQHENTFHLDPRIALDIGKSLSEKVILRHDYMPYEYTMYIFK